MKITASQLIGVDRNLWDKNKGGVELDLRERITVRGRKAENQVVIGNPGGSSLFNPANSPFRGISAKVDVPVVKREVQADSAKWIAAELREMKGKGRISVEGYSAVMDVLGVLKQVDLESKGRMPSDIKSLDQKQSALGEKKEYLEWLKVGMADMKVGTGCNIIMKDLGWKLTESIVGLEQMKASIDGLIGREMSMKETAAAA